MFVVGCARGGSSNTSHLCIPPTLAAALLRVSMRLQRLRGRGLAPAGEAGAQGAHGTTASGAELHRMVLGTSATALCQRCLLSSLGFRRDQPLPMRDGNRQQCCATDAYDACVHTAAMAAEAEQGRQKKRVMWSRSGCYKSWFKLAKCIQAETERGGEK